MTWETILQIAAIIFGAGGITSYIVSLRRTKAQNALDISSAWEKFSAPLLKRIEQLELKTALQEMEISDLRGWAEQLVRQVIDLGGTPVPFISGRRQKQEQSKG